jgi:shikimate kinase / 3-dehydroquinate synthase
MRTIVLSGFMATGKSTVGARLAARLGLPFVDTDESIASASGRSVAELWRAEGEAGFRAREAEIVTKLLEDDVRRVVAFGGGTVTSRVLRHRALDRAIVITLTADAERIVSRAGPLEARPNLAAFGDPVERTRQLLDQRAEAYAEAHFSISTEGIDADAVVDAIVPLVEDEPIAMPLGRHSYTIQVTNDRPARVTDAIARLAPSSLVIVTDSLVKRARGRVMEAALAPLTIPATYVTLPPGEQQKTIANAATIWDAALGGGIDRDALVVAFGGGVVGDLTGFAAATLLRGIRFLQVPTTLLAMVDSSVGGKTGFDHPAGKNLIGSFHQPSGVVVDLAHLSTLPARDRNAGLAEIVKIALATDASLLEAMEKDAEELAIGGTDALARVVKSAIEAKARVVRDDEHESGKRAILNLGHTLGHALEAHGRYARYRHGEAVAIGTVLELETSARLGFTPPELAARARALFTRLALPTSVPAGELAAAWSFVGADKKRVGSSMRLPVVTAVGRASVERVPLDRLREAALSV